MKCCVPTDVRTWTNLLTFEPGSDYSPNAATGFLSPISYKRWYAEFYYVGKIRRMGIGVVRRCRPQVVLNSFIHPAVETPLLEVHALHRVPF